MKLISTKMIKTIEFLFMKVRKILHTSDSVKRVGWGFKGLYFKTSDTCRFNNGITAEIFYSIRGNFKSLQLCASIPRFCILDALRSVVYSSFNTS